MNPDSASVTSPTAPSAPSALAERIGRCVSAALGMPDIAKALAGIVDIEIELEKIYEERRQLLRDHGERLRDTPYGATSPISDTLASP